jgi:hypothetical protein
MRKRMVGEVVRILNLMASTPNRREAPIDGDIEGNFSYWFDGGAVRYETGPTLFQLMDGTKIWQDVSLQLSLRIIFQEGINIRIKEE